MAQMREGRLLVAESSMRNGKAIRIGMRFLAANEERHNAPINPRIVATKRF